MLLPAAVSAVVLGGRLAAAASSGPVLPIDVKGPPPKYPIGAVKEPFAKVSGHLFEVNGTVGYFAGTNAWWLGHLSNNDDVDTVLKQFNDVGYTVVRVWGFGDVSVEPSEAAAASQTDPNRVWYQVINSTGTFVNYGETGLERLDYAVSAAERAGVKLVLPFVNYWDDYGGIQIYNKAFGGNKRTWYTDARSQKAYRAWIKVLVERYRESPAIFCWQLANEPRCEGCDDDYNTILRWVNETSAYIKSLDPHHMVTTGEEGFFDRSDKVNNGFGIYSGIAGSSFPRNTAIPTIDYGVFHLYPSWWGFPYEWGNTWIKEHEAFVKQIGKPVVLEEYGTPQPNNHSIAVAPWLKLIESLDSIAGDQLWQFGTANLSIDAKRLSDQFTVFIDEPEFEVLCRDHAAVMVNKKAKL